MRSILKIDSVCVLNKPNLNDLKKSQKFIPQKFIHPQQLLKQNPKDTYNHTESNAPFNKNDTENNQDVLRAYNSKSKKLELNQTGPNIISHEMPKMKSMSNLNEN